MNDFTKISTIKNIFGAQKIKKFFGQNFLINPGVLEKIIKAAELDKNDIIVEIGPGLGTLTKALAEKAGKIIAIEKDRDMIPILKKNLALFNNVEIIEGNALNYIPKCHNYKIVSNIPYNITSPLLDHFIRDQYMMSQSQNQNQNQPIHARKNDTPYKCNPKTIPSGTSKKRNFENENAKIRAKTLKDDEGVSEEDTARRSEVFAAESLHLQSKGSFLEVPSKLILMIQYEVAKKITAVPPNMNVLALHIQTFADIQYLFKVSKGSFYPSPKVDSAVIKITPLSKPRVDCDLKTYFDTIHRAFSQKRKQLKKSLGINDTRRPQELSIEEWSQIEPL
ncbi:16S rRNA (adenine(1518)-N(6)/adenine(1519)-N(6))-dimethyltransferase [Candidatus Peregrinibacteria bacterium]|nr:16S rRNA (adenine(1518)-N(6)/adenine(1519)-N(6))-dimethyltransferase [Candidatus Peregrinibacteria bacterium]